MFKPLTLAILTAAFAVSPALAQNPDGSITLTPSKQYELLQETRDQVARITAELRSRNQKLGERVTKVEEKTAYIQAKPIGELQRRVLRIEESLTEIERKLAGVQKQVTVLHAKKADK